MQFLKTLFWVALAVVLALLARSNWTSVTLKLWGGLLVDVNLPLLLLAAFLLGLLPTVILYRARLWALKRRLEPYERTAALAATAEPAPSPTPTVMTNEAAAGEERIATDSKIWP